MGAPYGVSSPKSSGLSVVVWINARDEDGWPDSLASKELADEPSRTLGGRFGLVDDGGEVWDPLLKLFFRSALDARFSVERVSSRKATPAVLS